jgi:hypothetical protein
VAGKVVQRPPRTAAHADRDALIRQFADAGLTAVVSTNGGIPDADIQVGKVLLSDGGKHGEVIGAWLTNAGQARLTAAQR